MYSQSTHRATGEERKAEINPNPKLHQVALACVGRLLFLDEDVEPRGEEQIYLYNQFNALRHADIRQTLNCCLVQPDVADARITNLVYLLQLSHVEVMALVLALLVEEEPMIGRVFAHIQAPVGGSRPTLGLVEAALAPLLNEQNNWVVGSMLAGPAIASGVLLLLNQQAPLPEQTLKVPMGLALLLRGKAMVWPSVNGIGFMDNVRLPPSILQQSARHATALTCLENNVLAIRSASRREARSVAVEIATQLKREAILIFATGEDLKGLGVACTMGNYLPVFEYTLAAEESAQLPQLMGYDGPRLVLTGPDGHVKTERGSIRRWNLLPPSQHERQQLWNEYLHQPALARQLASEHIHSAGRIAELAELAEREVRHQLREQPDMSDIRRAAWEAESGSLGGLAQPIVAEIPDEALVLSKSVNLELQQLLARCRARENLGQSLGITIKARYQEGVRCLMTGPSGTGKTLAASWLATKLGLPLYRVDLAAVVSKYIGETEKNLASLLARAEHSEIVLLFDEADSLFGKRTDIKDSTDRFANSQTNYLLQRIEFYRGIVLLTSNSRERFDAAFTRRLDKIIEFGLPNPQERRALWNTHLGTTHQLGIKEINQLAVASDLAGGHIRNAVLTAAVEASAAQRPITYQDVVIGLAGEYRKLGRQFPVELKRFVQTTSSGAS